jgi:uncharacterized repeat protein (TIGR01451 family)
MALDQVAGWASEVAPSFVQLALGIVGGLVASRIIRSSRRGRLMWFALFAVVAAMIGGVIVVDRVVVQNQLAHGRVALGVVVVARVSQGHAYARQVTAKPGDRITFAFKVSNAGIGTAKNVVVGVNLAPHLTPICGSPWLVDSVTGLRGTKLAATASGGCLGDSLFRGGVYVDDLAPGATETVVWAATVEKSLSGSHVMQTVGVAKALRVASETYNVASISVR